MRKSLRNFGEKIRAFSLAGRRRLDRPRMTPPCPAKCGKNAIRNCPWRARESQKSGDRITSKTAFSSPLEFQVARGKVRYWVRHKDCPLRVFPRAPLIESWQPTRAGLFCVKRTIFLSRRSGQLRVFMIRFWGRGGKRKADNLYVVPCRARCAVLGVLLVGCKIFPSGVSLERPTRPKPTEPTTKLVAILQRLLVLPLEILVERALRRKQQKMAINRTESTNRTERTNRTEPTHRTE